MISKYLYPRGGDAICALMTGGLLVQKGHVVEYWGMEHEKNKIFSYENHFVPHIDFNADLTMAQKMRYALNILYSFELKKRIEKVIINFRPDIVHMHNIAHQISPSILGVIKKYNIPTVMTIHDYKLVCPSYKLLRGSGACDKCAHGRYYWCLLHKCTKSSYVKSVINMFEMYLHLKAMKVYNYVDCYISPSIFLKNKFAKMGFKKKINFLPNFVKAGEYVPRYDLNKGIYLYLGRLSHEKGLMTMIDAVKDLGIVLNIMGAGPLEEYLKTKISTEKIKNVNLLGYLEGEKLKESISRSFAVIVPSEWEENNPRVVLEAFAVGKPVAAANIGGISELVEEGKTGWFFKPGDANSLKQVILYMENNPLKVSEAGKNARKLIEEEYGEHLHYQNLMKIYESVLKRQ